MSRLIHALVYDVGSLDDLTPSPDKPVYLRVISAGSDVIGVEMVNEDVVFEALMRKVRARRASSATVA